jgi:ribosome recycling factor
MKRAEKDGELSKNDLGRGQGEVQKLTDAHVAQIDEMLAAKESEILEI